MQINCLVLVSFSLKRITDNLISRLTYVWLLDKGRVSQFVNLQMTYKRSTQLSPPPTPHSVESHKQQQHDQHYKYLNMAPAICFTRITTMFVQTNVRKKKLF